MKMICSDAVRVIVPNVVNAAVPSNGIFEYMLEVFKYLKESDDPPAVMFRQKEGVLKPDKFIKDMVFMFEEYVGNLRELETEIRLIILDPELANLKKVCEEDDLDDQLKAVHFSHEDAHKKLERLKTAVADADKLLKEAYQLQGIEVPLNFAEKYMLRRKK